MFDRFTAPALEVVYHARAEAGEMGARAIEPERILVGVLNVAEGLGYRSGQSRPPSTMRVLSSARPALRWRRSSCERGRGVAGTSTSHLPSVTTRGTTS